MNQHDKDSLMPTQVLIVDDHPAVRMGLAAIIGTEPDMAVCGEAADASEAANMLESRRPDIIVMDMQRPDDNGLEFVERIRAQNRTIKVLVWSFHGDQVHAQLALNAGASCHLSKDVPASCILDAIRDVRDGRSS
jgi:DNA-binding NarL/FixJ family response regulator